MTLDDLKARLDEFSPVKVEFVARVVDSLSNPPNARIHAEGTWLTEPGDWIEYFGLALSVHHGATTEPLGLMSFETVFRNACKYMSWSVDPPGPLTQRFVDMTVKTDSGLLRQLRNETGRQSIRSHQQWERIDGYQRLSEVLEHAEVAA